MKAYEKLQKYWSDTGSKISTGPLDETLIGDLEAKYQLRLPDDFREYLRYSCPTTDQYDVEGTTWWPLSRIKTINEEYEHKITDPNIERDAPKYLFFADAMIWCWAWAIACGNDGRSGNVVVISGRDRIVATTFSEFVDIYIKADDSAWL
jgi:hypothetical protein